MNIETPSKSLPVFYFQVPRSLKAFGIMVFLSESILLNMAQQWYLQYM